MLVYMNFLLGLVLFQAIKCLRAQAGPFKHSSKNTEQWQDDIFRQHLFCFALYLEHVEVPLISVTESGYHVAPRCLVLSCEFYTWRVPHWESTTELYMILWFEAECDVILWKIKKNENASGVTLELQQTICTQSPFLLNKKIARFAYDFVNC